MLTYHQRFSVAFSWKPSRKKYLCTWHVFGDYTHGDVIKWKHFPRYWPFVRGIHRSPVNSPYKGQWRGALMFFFICTWIGSWVNKREAGNLRRHGTHYDVSVMLELITTSPGGQWVEDLLIVYFFLTEWLLMILWLIEPGNHQPWYRQIVVRFTKPVLFCLVTFFHFYVWTHLPLRRTEIFCWNSYPYDVSMICFHRS